MISFAQGELFPQSSYKLRDSLVGPDGSVPFFLLGCGRQKATEAMPANQLYVSKRFQTSRAVIEALGAPYAILSARYGVVSPEAVIDPYDTSLTDLSDEEQMVWAHNVLGILHDRVRSRQITILAVREYTHPITSLNRTDDVPLDIETPWETLSTPDIPIWLAQALRMASRIRDLAELYQWIAGKRASNEVFPFRSLAEQSVPKRGVYIFLDPKEQNFLGTGPRIVRVGTHAVSRGSKSSLRSRLRNHLGPASEIGNHRGSIFRLHVGRAMLEASKERHNLTTWGEGQDASPEIKALETDHEVLVSRYLQELELALIAISDEPAKDSLRAMVEAQLIALCTEDMHAIDCPSPNWLGSHSPIVQIRESGLWNIRGVGGKYDSAGTGSVASIIGGAVK